MATSNNLKDYVKSIHDLFFSSNLPVTTVVWCLTLLWFIRLYSNFLLQAFLNLFFLVSDFRSDLHSIFRMKRGSDEIHSMNLIQIRSVVSSSSLLKPLFLVTCSFQKVLLHKHCNRMMNLFQWWIIEPFPQLLENKVYD